MRFIKRSLISISFALYCAPVLSWTITPEGAPVITPFLDPAPPPPPLLPPLDPTRVAEVDVLGIQNISSFAGAGTGIGKPPDTSLKNSSAFIQYKQDYVVANVDNQPGESMRIRMTGFLFGNLNAKRSDFASRGNFSASVIASASFGPLNWSTQTYPDWLRRFRFESEFESSKKPVLVPPDGEPHKLQITNNKVILNIKENVQKINPPEGVRRELEAFYPVGTYTLLMQLKTDASADGMALVGAGGQFDINPPPQPKFLNMYSEQLTDESRISPTSDSGSQNSEQDYNNDMMNFYVTLQGVSD